MFLRIFGILIALLGWINVALGAPTDGGNKGPEAQRCGATVEVTTATRKAMSGVKMLLLGELHGTNEVPEFALTLACQLAAEGSKVVLALEMPASTQPAIDLLMESGGTKSEELLTTPFWSKTMPFGVSSSAMFGLLRQVATQPAVYRDISVLAFDPPLQTVSTDSPQSPARITQVREDGMAQNLMKSVARNPEAIHVIVVGNLHATRQIGSRNNPLHRPLAAILAEKLPMLNFTVAHAGGKAWVCSPKCGPTEFSANSEVALPRRIEEDPARKEGGFDGVFYVGNLTVAAPQRELRAAQ